VISGTPIAEDALSDVVVTAEDTGNYTADTTAFSITISAAAQPIKFVGPVPDQTEEQNSPVSINVDQYFEGTERPFNYTQTGGTLPAGLTLGASTGVISGTPTTVETQAGIVIQGQDTAANIAQTNPFEIDILAEVIPVKRQGEVPSLNLALGATVFLDVSQYFTGTQLPFTYAVTQGALPSWASLDPNTGIISGTADDVDSGTVIVTVTDADDNSAASNVFTVEANQVVQRRLYRMNEGSGTIIVDSLSPNNGAWADDLGWTSFLDNTRYYPMNVAANGISNELICLDGQNRRREDLDGEIINYNEENWIPPGG
jgi:hypothetical protein